jgi:uncharacterized protein (TIGR00725 family)
MAKAVAGVMGPGEDAKPADLTNARELGRLLANDGWVVLSGGRDAGVMREVNRGAKSVGGLTVGVLPSASSRASADVDIVIVTEMHNARNNINVLSSHVVISCGDGGPGTVSEVALAMKAGKPVILLGVSDLSRAFYSRLARENMHFATTAAEAVRLASRYNPTGK